VFLLINLVCSFNFHVYVLDLILRLSTILADFYGCYFFQFNQVFFIDLREIPVERFVECGVLKIEFTSS